MVCANFETAVALAGVVGAVETGLDVAGLDQRPWERRAGAYWLSIVPLSSLEVVTDL